MRARPKILLCTTFEEAWDASRATREHPRRDLGHRVPARAASWSREAGRRVRARWCARRCPTCRSCCSRAAPRTRPARAAVGAAFLLKGSPTLLQRAAPLHDRELRLRRLRVPHCPTARGRPRRRPQEPRGEARTVPAESIAYHAERNHFSNWLKARTEFALAHELRPRKVADFATLEDLRADLIDVDRRVPARARPSAVVADFDRQTLRRRAAFFPASAAARSAARRAAWPSSAACSTTRRAAPLPGRADRRAAGGGARRPTFRPVPRRQRPARLRASRATTTTRCCAASWPPPFPTSAVRDLRRLPHAVH